MKYVRLGELDRLLRRVVVPGHRISILRQVKDLGVDGIQVEATDLPKNGTVTAAGTVRGLSYKLDRNNKVLRAFMLVEDLNGKTTWKLLHGGPQ